MFKTTALWLWAMSDVMRTYKQPRERLDIEAGKKLQRILIAAQNVSYYRNIMRELDYNPEHDFRGTQDIQLFPILTKDMVKEYGEKAFTQEGVDLSRQFSDSTSGSTGLPLKIYRDPRARALQLAKWLRVLFVNGCSVFDKTLSFTSPDRLEEGKSIFQKLGLLRRHPVDFLLPAEEMVNAMLDYQPSIIYGNRSSLDLVSEELQRRGITYPLKLLVVGGEIIEEKHRLMYQKCFETRLVESYGSVELGVIAFATPEQDGLFLCEDQNYFEFINDEGDTAKPGDEARIIITDLANTLMPFIRYEQGDKVIYRDAQADEKKAWRRLDKVIGRDNDFVLLPDGKKVQAPVFYKLLSTYHGINRFRVLQKTHTTFEIYLQAEPEYVCSVKEDLVKHLKEKINMLCDFSIIQIDRLQPEQNGKFRMLVSEA